MIDTTKPDDIQIVEKKGKAKAADEVEMNESMRPRHLMR
jgi:hypothetical protein